MLKYYDITELEWADSAYIDISFNMAIFFLKGKNSKNIQM